MIDYKTDMEKKMLSWWQNSLGQSILRQEKTALRALSNHFYGNYQFQLGIEQRLLPDVSRNTLQKVLSKTGDVEACYQALPLKCHCLDTLLLVHVLEFSVDPHQVLREVERVLVADGTVVLCCFNPWSLLGLRRLISWQDQPPWQGRFFSQTRIRDWLALLNFEVIATERLMFQPAFSSEKWLARFSPMERWGKRLWPVFSGVTILVAKKRTIPLTPITPRWHKKQLFPPRQLVNKPATREKSNG
jgi:SAM-dependent methyltransferase